MTGKTITGVVLTFLMWMGSATALAAPQPLVEANWLNGHLDDERLVILDIRSAIDDGNQIAFGDGHIPGAVHSSYTDAGWRVERDGIVGKLPPVEDLERLIGGLGISNDDTVIIVPAGTGATDFGSAARVYWTFKVLGHDRVGILNGGYRAWVQAGNPVTTGASQPTATEFTATFQPQLLATTDEVVDARRQGVQLVDARPSAYFAGDEKHPRARVAGTIPEAVNIQHQRFIAEGAAWRFDPQRVRAIIDEAALDTGKRTVTFCNTGHWAATTWFALSEVQGLDDASLYDGSMVEWTASESRPVQVAKRGLARVIEFFGG